MPRPDQFAESPESVGLDSARIEDLFARAQREVDAGNIPSCQVAVARQGRLAAMRTFGQVTHEGAAADAGDDTLYVIFSCTKAITSAAGWILIQEGKLGLDERVADVIPEFGTNGKQEVRVEQLFTHTSGFPQAPFPAEEWSDRGKRLERFARWRLNWEPGTRFEYHPTSSMWVIAELVERRSGMPLGEFVRARIAGPLGLDLWMGLPRALHGRLADIVHSGAEATPEELVAAGWPAVLPETEVTEEAIQGFNRDFVREAGVPGGGGCTTAGDLALLYQAFLDGRAADGTEVWKPEMLRRARDVRTGELTDPVFGQRVNRGLGVVVARSSERVMNGFGHTGSAFMFGHGGAGGQIGWADPVTGISFGFTTNGFDRHQLRQARRGVALSSRAGACGLR
jgi:CubicO group peptidase (beta-lactamase class C family)